MKLNKIIIQFLFFSLFLSGICRETFALIITDIAIVEAKIVFLSNDYIPDDRDIPEILKVPYIAEIEIKKIAKDPVFSAGRIENLKQIKTRINSIEYVNTILKETLKAGDDIVCFMLYDSCEYHQYGYRTSISITLLHIIKKSDYLEKKKIQILEILQDDEYQHKEEVLRKAIKPENIYVTEWKISDFITELEKQKSYLEKKLTETGQEEYVLRQHQISLHTINRYLEAISLLDHDANIYEVKRPALQKHYTLLVDLEHKKVLEVLRISLFF